MEINITKKENLGIAIKAFRKKVQKEGIINEARIRQSFEKPSDKQIRKAKESIIKTRMMRKFNK